mgnify:CR=1 FL=1
MQTRTAITAIEQRDDGRFAVQTSAGTLLAESLVVATGGLSIPRMGATGFGYAIARQFGHGIVPTRAGLVPLTLSGRPLDEIDGLAGIALPAAAEVDGQRFSSAVLFTHRGLSGPAILQISSYWNAGERLWLDLLPGDDAGARLRAAKAEAPGGWRGARPFRIARKVKESEEITSFHLQAEDGGPLMEFLPGQYIGLRLENDGKEERRNY